MRRERRGRVIRGEVTRALVHATVGVLILTSLAGCLGTLEANGEASLDDPDVDGANAWEAGLDETYPTPEVAIHRSTEGNNADMAEPGDPAFAVFDAAMVAWMAAHDIPTGQIAIMHEGELVYTNGYGHTDRDEAQPADQNTLFRLASVTKPMTAALIELQVEQGLYDWSDPVFCVPPEPRPDCRLPIEPHPNLPVVDDRLEDVTVEHLLSHTGGWDRTSDWMWHSPGSIDVAEDLGVESPPSAWQTAQYLMGQPLDHDPGGTNEDGYCNLCYMLAGLIAEEATGAELAALYDAYLFAPLGVSEDIEVGYTLPEERNGREPFYPCEFGEVPSVYAPTETVCWADGGWAQEGSLLAMGGLIGTASAVATVYEAYGEHAFTSLRLNGTTVDLGVASVTVGGFEWSGHTGGLPGTATMAGIVEDDDTVAGEIQYVALFNSRTQGPHEEPSCSLLYCTVYALDGVLMPMSTAWSGVNDAAAGAGVEG